MRFRSKLLQRRVAAAETTPTLKKTYDVYMAPDGHFAAGEQEDAVEDAKPRNRLERKPSTSFAQKIRLLAQKIAIS
jgi:hypothetical protein